MILFALVLQAATPAAPASALPAPTAAFGQPASATVATQLASTQPASQRICRAQAITGSRIGAFLICMSKADWDAKAQQSGDYTASIQGTALFFNPR